jgi:hypothetical protein
MLPSPGGGGPLSAMGDRIYILTRRDDAIQDDSNSCNPALAEMKCCVASIEAPFLPLVLTRHVQGSYIGGISVLQRTEMDIPARTAPGLSIASCRYMGSCAAPGERNDDDTLGVTYCHGLDTNGSHSNFPGSLSARAAVCEYTTIQSPHRLVQPRLGRGGSAKSSRSAEGRQRKGHKRGGSLQINCVFCCRRC